MEDASQGDFVSLYGYRTAMRSWERHDIPVLGAQQPRRRRACGFSGYPGDEHERASIATALAIFLSYIRFLPRRHAWPSALIWARVASTMTARRMW